MSALFFTSLSRSAFSTLFRSLNSEISCLLACCLLIAWVSPVVYAKPQQPGQANLININTASIEELATLPRIGEKVAQRIVSYRNDHGPFKKTEDIKAVRGIGDKVYKKIQPLIAAK